VWGHLERSPFAALPSQTLMRQLNLPPPAPGTPGPFSLADTGSLERLLREAGFAGARTERTTVTMKFASAGDYTAFVRAVGATSKNLLRDKPKDQQEDAWNAISHAALSFASPDGSITPPGEAICVVGSRERAGEMLNARLPSAAEESGVKRQPSRKAESSWGSSP
jgi:enediyne biosynthesis protein CalE5